MKKKEILTICFGQAGLNIGEAVVKQYDAEAKGALSKNGEPVYGHCFFEECAEGQTKGVQKKQYKARIGGFDSDSSVVDRLLATNVEDGFFHEHALHKLQVSKATYVDGFACIDHFSDGEEGVSVNNTINRLLEPCNDLDGVILNYALSGGTGSGLASAVMELEGIFRKKLKLSFQIWPSNSFSAGPVSKINSVFSLGWHMSKSQESKAPDTNIVVDNEAIYWQLKRAGLSPTLGNINETIAMVHSSITLPFRKMSGGIDKASGLQSFRTYVVEGRANFVTAAHTRGSVEGKPLSLNEMVAKCCDPKNCFINYTVDEAPEGQREPPADMHRYLNVLFRGRENPRDKESKMKRKLNGIRMEAVKSGACRMAPKRSTCCKAEVLSSVASVVPGSNLSEGRDLTMFANNAALGHVLEKRILRPTRIFNRNLPPYNEHYSVMWGEWSERRMAIYDYIDATSELANPNHQPTDRSGESGS